jgi:hypothetical protein
VSKRSLDDFGEAPWDREPWDSYASGADPTARKALQFDVYRSLRREVFAPKALEGSAKVSTLAGWISSGKGSN